MTPRHRPRSARPTALTLLLSLTGPGLALAQAPGSPVAEIQAEIARLDSIWLNALVTADVEAVASVLADDFVGQVVETIMDKDAILERTAASTDTEAMLLDNLVVNVYGDVAVAHAVRRSVSNAGVESRFAYTDVYRFRDGRWLAITGQSAALPND